MLSVALDHVMWSTHTEGVQFYAVLHYWHLLYRGEKKIGKLEYVTCEVSTEINGKLLYPPVFS